MKRKLAIICICAFAVTGISAGIINNINSEADVHNREAFGTVGSYNTEKDIGKESVQQGFDEVKKLDKDLQSTDVTELHVANESSKSAKYKVDSESKKSLSEKASTENPVHIHEWKPVANTENKISQIPVYGDVCRSCGKNVTGWADKHLLEGDCTGYDTDVIVSYKEVTEEVNYTIYKCSCGATK